MSEKSKRYPGLFWGILALALVLRLYLALSSVYIWDEDRDWLALADSISVHNLPLHGDHRSAFPAYFMKAGSLLLGRNPVGFRFFNIVAGVFTVALIYKFTLEWTNSLPASYFAASLLAINEYHIGASVIATEKSLYLLFALLATAAFIRFLRTEKTLFLYGSAALIGLSFLCKELALLLIPIFGIILLLPQYRPWLRRREPYQAVVVFLAVISLDIYWNLTRHDPSQVALIDRVSQMDIGFTPQPLMFYFHYAVRAVYWLFHQKVNGWEEYPHQNLVFGSMLFAGVLLTTFRLGSKPYLIVLTFLFWFILGFFLFMPSNHPVPKDLGSSAFYWIDITLLPAVVLAGHQFSRISKKWRPLIWGLFGIGVMCSFITLVFFNLGLPVLSVAYNPAFIQPASGEVINVQTKFSSCMICEKEPKVELLDIRLLNDSTSSSVVNTQDVTGATVGADVRSFGLRATDSRLYEIIYRITYSSGTSYVLSSEPGGTRGVHVANDGTPMWRSPFWVY